MALVDGDIRVRPMLFHENGEIKPSRTCTDNTNFHGADFTRSADFGCRLPNSIWRVARVGRND
jgi:hypothetical protein